jgi:hypothetical protein
MTVRTSRPLAAGLAAVRIAAGVALGATPQRFLTLEPRGAGSSMPLTLRTVGIRDLAVGLGTATAVRSGTEADLRRWLWAGALSDALDVVAGLTATRETRGRSLLSVAMAVPMVVADAYALRLHRAPVS